MNISSLRRRARRVALAAFVVFASVAMGCGGGGAGGSAPTTAPELRLLAGTTVGPGYADGAQARFSQPTGIAVDREDNVYVADTGNHVIRKIGRDGVVTTLAGMAGQSDTADGVGGEARFDRPVAVGVDSSGNVYVADQAAHAIRKITPAGSVSTIAGSAGAGFADGPGAQARFQSPSGIAVDGDGNAYVADSGNSSIRKITPAGIVSTIAGGPFGTPAFSNLISYPVSVVADEEQNVYFVDQRSVRRIDRDGRISTLAEGITTGLLNGLARDGAGSIYVTEDSRETLRRITSDGQTSVLTDVYSGCSTGSPGYFHARGVAVRPDGHVLVTSLEESVVCQLSFNGGMTLVAGGGAGDPPDVPQVIDSSGASQRLPSTGYGIAVDAQGNVFIAAHHSELLRLGADHVLTKIGPGARDVAVDAQGNVYAAINPVLLGIHMTEVLKISPTGQSTTLKGTIPSSQAFTSSLFWFDGPLGIAVDPSGNVYVSEATHVIRKVTPEGIVSVLAGTRGQSGSGDGPGLQAQFNTPQGLAADPAGNVYVADTGNHLIRKIAPDGVVSTIAGSPTSAGYADGVGTAARFSAPTRVALDPDGSLWVADRDNYVVRKITPGASVTTVVGKPGRPGIVLGELPGGIDSPRGIAATPAGLYILSGQALLRSTAAGAY
ncbi:MAG TPA: hypothetical protein VGE20_02305 [Ramlibacter sp.]